MGKRLRILAGPNGSGKSSVYKTLVQKKEFQWGVFVNADEIEKKLREEQYLNIQSYGVEDFDWGKFQADYQSFVDLINVGRVATRVIKGGHDVPEEKIKSRYERSLRNLHEAILLSDRAYIFDNSESSHQWIAEYDGATGELRYKEDEIPQWVEQYV